jgi:ankyrin repeat protein
MAYLSSNYGPKIEFVRALLRAGAKVNLKNDYGDDVYDKLSSSSASDDIKDLLKQSE